MTSAGSIPAGFATGANRALGGLFKEGSFLGTWIFNRSPGRVKSFFCVSTLGSVPALSSFFPAFKKKEIV